MQIELGKQIRELRRRDGRTQEALAAALGVTSQAVSRWESDGGYPDMEMIPRIANYFGVSIDELFGYHGDRERKITALLEEADVLLDQNVENDVSLDECLALLRDGLAEFPGEERIMHKLASALSATGWRRHREWLDYGEDGHLRHCFDHHRKNEYWNEATQLFETLLVTASDDEIRTDTRCQLALLYRNVGEYRKAIELSKHLPTLRESREILLTNATDGKEQSGYLGESLLELAYLFAEQLLYALVNDRSLFETDLPVRKVQGAISLFRLIGDGGNIGMYHREVAYLYLYLSRLQWEQGQRNEAFDSLDAALREGRAYDAFKQTEHPVYDAPLLRYAFCRTERFLEGESVAAHLPESWPMWCNPDYTAVQKEITADPRWAEWVKRTQSV